MSGFMKRYVGAVRSGALVFSACTFFAATLFSQPCDDKILTSTSPPPYSAAYCIGADSGFLVNGGPVTFSAGRFIHLGIGFHAHPSFHASVTPPAPPSAVSLTPANASGSQQVFTFLASDPNGGEDISGLQLHFTSATVDVNACDFWVDRQSKQVSLLNDAGGGWGSPV